MSDIRYTQTVTPLFKYNTIGAAIFLLSVMTITSCYTIKPYEEKQTVIKHIRITNVSANKKYGSQKIAVESNAFIEKSLKPLYITKIPFVLYKCKKPPILDTFKLEISKKNISEYLKTQGYFNNKVDYKIDTISSKKNIETKIRFGLSFGNQFYINDIRLQLKDIVVEQVSKNNYGILFEGTIKKDMCSFDLIDKMIKKIVSIHNELGYYNISGKDIRVELDTTINRFSSKYKFVNLIFSYSKITELDSLKLKRYLIRSVSFITNYDPNDSSSHNIPLTRYKDIFYDSVNNIIKPIVLWNINKIKKGHFFTEREYKQSITNLYLLNVWSMVNAQPSIVEDTFINNNSIGQIDLKYLLQKEKKYSLGSELGLGYNFYNFGNQNVITNQNSGGINLSGFFNTKNLFKKAIESKLVGKVSIESFLNTYPISTSTVDFLVNYSHKIPWLSPFPYVVAENFLLNSSWDVSLGYTKRINYFDIQKAILNTTWKIENKKNESTIEFNPISFSLILISKFKLFIDDEKINPYLKYAFNEGITCGIILDAIKNMRYTNFRNHYSKLYFSIEESGSTWSKLFNFLSYEISGKKSLPSKYSIFEFVKTEFNFVHTVKWKNTSFAFRFKTGYGYSFGSDTIRSKTMPFFKQFAVGGPNSIRGWNHTRLGLGSSNTSAYTDFKDKYGDVMLETNFEYRFDIAKFKSFILESAFFVDIGNIWNRKTIENESEKSIFKINKLLLDLAASYGTGLRFHFDFLILRLDIGCKLKDPTLSENTKKQFMLPTNYVSSNSFSLHLGIGYPF